MKMEDHFNNKKGIIIVFVLMICLFLFIYKGFIQSGENYQKMYDEYANNLIKTNSVQSASSLKKTKFNDKNSTATTKNKIPEELLEMDNSLLDAKSLLSGIKSKNEKIISTTNLLLSNRNNMTNEQVDILINEIKTDLNLAQDEIDSIYKNMEGVANDVQKLRKKMST